MPFTAPIFDFHMHAFPDAIAARTIAHLETVCHTKPHTDGTAGGLLRYLAENKFAAGVLMQIATKPSQQHTVNNWAAALQREHPNLYAFGSIHPDAPDWEEELWRIRDLGLKGVKLHPDYQHFHTDEERMRPIYRTLAETGLPVLFHGGIDPLCPEDVHNPPRAMARVLEWEPTLCVIDAHLGDMQNGRETLNCLAGAPLYLDLSMACVLLPLSQVAAIVERHGAGRILFGTDCPWGEPQKDLEVVKALQLSPGEEEQILSGNAKKILGL